MSEVGTSQRRKLRIPVLGATAAGAFVVYLVLEAPHGAKRDLVRHPHTALQAYGLPKSALTDEVTKNRLNLRAALLTQPFPPAPRRRR
jgi:hypothetical protein